MVQLFPAWEGSNLRAEDGRGGESNGGGEVAWWRFCLPRLPPLNRGCPDALGALRLLLEFLIGLSLPGGGL